MTSSSLGWLGRLDLDRAASAWLVHTVALGPVFALGADAVGSALLGLALAAVVNNHHAAVLGREAYDQGLTCYCNRPGKTLDSLQTGELTRVELAKRFPIHLASRRVLATFGTASHPQSDLSSYQLTHP